VISNDPQTVYPSKIEFSMILGAGINVKRVGIELRYSLISSLNYIDLPQTLNLTVLYGFSMAKKDKSKSK
jgi:hypothetical protein